jgi:hypothetical protein
MKRNNTKNSKELKLERRLALVRTTVRELNSNQLGQANGGSTGADPTCHVIYTI